MWNKLLARYDFTESILILMNGRDGWVKPFFHVIGKGIIIRAGC